MTFIPDIPKRQSTVARQTHVPHPPFTFALSFIGLSNHGNGEQGEITEGEVPEHHPETPPFFGVLIAIFFFFSFFLPLSLGKRLESFVHWQPSM